MRKISEVMFGLALLLTLFVGCGPESGTRRPISGSVTFQGKPVKMGSISFLSTAGPQGGGLLQEGKFQIPAEMGLEPGTYKVSVSWAEGVEQLSPTQSANGEGPSAREMIPAKYNAETELSVEVTSDGPNKFDLKLD